MVKQKHLICLSIKVYFITYFYHIIVPEESEAFCEHVFECWLIVKWLQSGQYASFSRVLFKMLYSVTSGCMSMPMIGHPSWAHTASIPGWCLIFLKKFSWVRKKKSSMSIRTAKCQISVPLKPDCKGELTLFILKVQNRLSVIFVSIPSITVACLVFQLTW